MIKRFSAFLVFVIGIHVAHARLGETEKQLVERFGAPSSRATHKIFAQGKFVDLGPTLHFKQDDWRIDCDLIDERVVRIHYRKPGDRTEGQVQLVLGYNTQDLKWAETSKPSIAKLQRTWKRDDGATAEWSKSGGIKLVVPAYDRAKQVVEAKAKAEASKKPKI
jgi:hypothetical protein